MGVRGMDISNHQAGMDVERVVRENNIGFVFVLSNDGTFKNPHYRSQMDGARRGGAIAIPYVYLRTNVDQTYETFRQQEPTPGPVIVDVEDGSGGRAECDRMHDRLHGDGYPTPLLYWPDWYRKKVGTASLSGLPPLWTSWYPDYVNRGFDDGLAQVPSWVWNGYGGLATLIVQFTSSGRLSGYAGNLDLNYFPGSGDELVALLGGDTMSSADAWNGFAGALNAASASVSEGKPDDVAKALQAFAWNGAAGMFKAAAESVDAGAPDDVAQALRKIVPSGSVAFSPEQLAELRSGLADEVADKLAARLRD